MEDNKIKYKYLIELLNKSLGDRSWNQFAQSAGVDSGHLSRIKNGNFNKPPKPDFLYKLSLRAHNGVTYEQLMQAAGYISDNETSFNNQIIKKDDTPQVQDEVQKKYEYVVAKAKSKNISPERLDKLIDILNDDK